MHYSGTDNLGLGLELWYVTQLSTIFQFYYIVRCELWGFIREINSGISHVKYQFFPPELL